MAKKERNRLSNSKFALSAHETRYLTQNSIQIWAASIPLSFGSQNNRSSFSHPQSFKWPISLRSNYFPENRSWEFKYHRLSQFLSFPHALLNRKRREKALFYWSVCIAPDKDGKQTVVQRNTKLDPCWYLLFTCDIYVTSRSEVSPRITLTGTYEGKPIILLMLRRKRRRRRRDYQGILKRRRRVSWMYKLDLDFLSSSSRWKVCPGTQKKAKFLFEHTTFLFPHHVPQIKRLFLKKASPEGGKQL